MIKWLVATSGITLFEVYLLENYTIHKMKINQNRMTVFYNILLFIYGQYKFNFKLSVNHSNHLHTKMTELISIYFVCNSFCFFEQKKSNL